MPPLSALFDRHPSPAGMVGYALKKSKGQVNENLFLPWLAVVRENDIAFAQGAGDSGT